MPEVDEEEQSQQDSDDTKDSHSGAASSGNLQPPANNGVRRSSVFLSPARRARTADEDNGQDAMGADGLTSTAGHKPSSSIQATGAASAGNTSDLSLPSAMHAGAGSPLTTTATSALPITSSSHGNASSMLSTGMMMGSSLVGVPLEILPEVSERSSPVTTVRRQISIETGTSSAAARSVKATATPKDNSMTPAAGAVDDASEEMAYVQQFINQRRQSGSTPHSAGPMGTFSLKHQQHQFQQAASTGHPAYNSNRTNDNPLFSPNSAEERRPHHLRLRSRASEKSGLQSSPGTPLGAAAGSGFSPVSNTGGNTQGAGSSSSPAHHPHRSRPSEGSEISGRVIRSPLMSRRESVVTTGSSISRTGANAFGGLTGQTAAAAAASGAAGSMPVSTRVPSDESSGAKRSSESFSVERTSRSSKRNSDALRIPIQIEDVRVTADIVELSPKQQQQQGDGQPHSAPAGGSSTPQSPGGMKSSDAWQREPSGPSVNSSAESAEVAAAVMAFAAKVEAGSMVMGRRSSNVFSVKLDNEPSAMLVETVTASVAAAELRGSASNQAMLARERSSDNLMMTTTSISQRTLMAADVTPSAAAATSHTLHAPVPSRGSSAPTVAGTTELNIVASTTESVDPSNSRAVGGSTPQLTVNTALTPAGGNNVTAGLAAAVNQSPKGSLITPPRRPSVQSKKAEPAGDMPASVSDDSVLVVDLKSVAAAAPHAVLATAAVDSSLAQSDQLGSSAPADQSSKDPKSDSAKVVENHANRDDGERLNDQRRRRSRSPARRHQRKDEGGHAGDERHGDSRSRGPMDDHHSPKERAHRRDSDRRDNLDHRSAARDHSDRRNRRESPSPDRNKRAERPRDRSDHHRDQPDDTPRDRSPRSSRERTRDSVSPKRSSSKRASDSAGKRDSADHDASGRERRHSSRREDDDDRVTVGNSGGASRRSTIKQAEMLSDPASPRAKPTGRTPRVPSKGSDSDDDHTGPQQRTALQGPSRSPTTGQRRLVTSQRANVFRARMASLVAHSDPDHEARLHRWKRAQSPSSARMDAPKVSSPKGSVSSPKSKSGKRRAVQASVEVSVAMSPRAGDPAHQRDRRDQDMKHSSQSSSVAQRTSPDSWLRGINDLRQPKQKRGNTGGAQLNENLESLDDEVRVRVLPPEFERPLRHGVAALFDSDDDRWHKRPLREQSDDDEENGDLESHDWDSDLPLTVHRYAELKRQLRQRAAELAAHADRLSTVESEEPSRRHRSSTSPGTSSPLAFGTARPASSTAAAATDYSPSISTQRTGEGGKSAEAKLSTGAASPDPVSSPQPEVNSGGMTDHLRQGLPDNWMAWLAKEEEKWSKAFREVLYVSSEAEQRARELERQLRASKHHERIYREKVINECV